MIDGLGSEFLITQGFIKMHPVGRSIHPALDLIEDILARRPARRLDPREVEHIRFVTYLAPTLLSNKTPRPRSAHSSRCRSRWRRSSITAAAASRISTRRRSRIR